MAGQSSRAIAHRRSGDSSRGRCGDETIRTRRGIGRVANNLGERIWNRPVLGPLGAVIALHGYQSLTIKTEAIASVVTNFPELASVAVVFGATSNGKKPAQRETHAQQAIPAIAQGT